MKAVRIIAALAVVGTIAAPAVAQAMTPAQHEAQRIAPEFRQQLNARVGVLDATYPGLRLGTTTVRCGSSAGNSAGAFYCTGTYALLYQGQSAKYLDTIDGQTDGAWKSVGSATLISGGI